ncbi:aminomethyl-transferring glycine dehydrogenase [Kiloniella laminariae]|uniref:Glycine dehydrogenase (decarboxylating) n=1 Tax=Kiloniella laminariae TaxID=454162 RepID=A0ABT4LL14_9PROT|nr:aminomethyl-transferring glycine dehydrogenase [Kiloniella laminariae]MCZ4281800.1 aminomethyl-transferring glycine dehydrogenase [Kiloniella laminariae]
MSDTKLSLQDLEQKTDFIRRHIGPREAEMTEMLSLLGLESLDDLSEKTVPKSIRETDPLALAESRTESDVLAYARSVAKKNKVFKSYIGMGYYGTKVPSVILRNVLENPGWYTAYTPYQAEISQGRLEAILNYQTMISDLTGMEMANSSMLDEGTAAAEAMTFCRRVAKSKAEVFFVDQDLLPQSIDVIKTRAEALDYEIQIGDPRKDLDPSKVYGALFQYPGTSGRIDDYSDLIAAVQEHKGLAGLAADILALTLLKSPGELGADFALGSAQRFGVPMGFGGPHAGYFATKDAYKRSIPARLVGMSVDAHGAPALRMALQTREQHIRREKANSNICTAQALLANMAGFYATYHGPKGLKLIARRVARLTSILAAGLKAGGVDVVHSAFFDTLTIKVPGKAKDIAAKARKEEMNLRLVDGDTLGISLDETTLREDIATLWAVFGVSGQSVDKLDQSVDSNLPEGLARQTSFLTHPVFNSYHSETEMMRYLRKLSDKDIGLDRAMIPLGSCTMKLNAATEMIPVTWPEFSNIHPFVPLDQAEGYIELIKDLEAMLVEITGYDAISLQPNSGSQGEYAGLLAIRKYHESRGDMERDICLIPASAHGTNPASAALAGMKVVVVNCDEEGYVDNEDLRLKAEKHKDNLAAVMITYPSTHGVFEEEVRTTCKIVHDFGGQVYIDGANMNAMVGLAKPGKFGGDVSHLNLHKTFCIPHGGGGPGVGPIGVGKHLAPFLPNHSVVAEAGPVTGQGAITSAPWGSASILPITWVYLKLMGAEGLRKATQAAILNANYLAKRLSDHYPILYASRNGMVAHECIVDVRPLKETAGITVDDIAKRLIDYGFHAPTMSFPVAGTLMIEPTESESKYEVDRLADALISIRKEIARVERGELPGDDNMLCNAPHTAASLLAEEWKHPYSRDEAAYPVENLRDGKYWAPVGRVDNVYGDRNLVCSCPSIESYRDAAE